MVEHLWIRLAELKEEAREEEWEAHHPRQARARQLLRKLRVRYLLLRKAFVEHPRVQRLLSWSACARDQLVHRSTIIYLALLRLMHMPPARERLTKLTTREIIDEIDRRGLDHSACLERDDLLHVLCGPLLHGDRVRDRDLSSEPEEEAVLLDKMV
jgi:hypothetical protein